MKRLEYPSPTHYSSSNQHFCVAAEIAETEERERLVSERDRNNEKSSEVAKKKNKKECAWLWNRHEQTQLLLLFSLSFCLLFYAKPIFFLFLSAFLVLQKEDICWTKIPIVYLYFKLYLFYVNGGTFSQKKCKWWDHRYWYDIYL